MSVRARIAAAVRLGVRDPRSLLLSVRMSAWIVLISIVARLVPLPTMFRLAETRRRWPPSALLPAEELARRIDRVFHAGLVKDGSCWKRSAVLRRYLQLNGIETDVVFGVRRQDGGQLAGHAWLEREGVPFLENEPPQYTVTFRYPPR
ncbi:MAG TPA: lasso peptide biosynthesis B2 protein [Thermoanaerobaculia bacterium]|nr:lasso peptide biosynthesis B2 protein [Thermoanaerobaculia bacterium]